MYFSAQLANCTNIPAENKKTGIKTQLPKNAEINPPTKLRINNTTKPVSYTHLRAHETEQDNV